MFEYLYKTMYIKMSLNCKENFMFMGHLSWRKRQKINLRSLHCGSFISASINNSSDSIALPAH